MGAGQGTIRITLDGPTLAAGLGCAPDDLAAASLNLGSDFELRRRGVEARLVTGASAPAPDQALIRMLARARRWASDLRAGRPLAAITAREACSAAYIRTRAQLAFLSPRIQAAILAGRQPPDLALERLVRFGVPLDWEEQARIFGVGD